MTKEKLYQKWVIQYDTRGVGMKEFFKDLDRWYVEETKSELEKIREKLIQEWKEKEAEISNCTRIDKDGDCLASEPCPHCESLPKRFLKGYDCYD